MVVGGVEHLEHDLAGIGVCGLSEEALGYVLVADALGGEGDEPVLDGDADALRLLGCVVEQWLGHVDWNDGLAHGSNLDGRLLLV